MADIALASRLFAPHYAKAVIRSVSGRVPLYVSPDPSSDKIGEIQAGEKFALLDVTGSWAWGYREADHLVGYIEASLLA